MCFLFFARVVSVYFYPSVGLVIVCYMFVCLFLSVCFSSVSFFCQFYVVFFFSLPSVLFVFLLVSFLLSLLFTVVLCLWLSLLDVVVFSCFFCETVLMFLCF